MTATEPLSVDERPMPQEIQAEQIVLGAMMTIPSVIVDVQEILTAADFYKPAHYTIFNTITKLHRQEEPSSAAAVVFTLVESGEILRVGGAEYIHTLINSVPLTASATWFAKNIKTASTKRRLVEIGMRITQLGLSNSHELADAIDLAQQSIHELTVSRSSNDDAPPFAEALTELNAHTEALQRGDASGLSTGFPDLDRKLKGLQPGQLLLVAARPAMGKSVLGVDIARHNAIQAGKSVSLFSLEMQRLELTQRIMSAETGRKLPLTELRAGQMDDDKWVAMARRQGEIADSRLYLEDSPNMTLESIRSKCRRRQQKNGLDLVIVDYLQLIDSIGKSENRQNEVAKISRGLKLLAKEIGCPIIALSQLNRQSETRPDKRPTLSDLRDSGSLEQDADIVLLLHREDYYDAESTKRGEAEIIVAKNRNGERGSVNVAAQLHHARFVSMAID